MSSNSQSQNIQVTIELGHQASFKKKPSPEGYTHDWSVFVRGPEGSKIQHYVEKVVFQLHESFAKPKRVVKEPPYQVSESGYAGFNFPIIIYFRNKEIPKKISFDYDLFLNAENCPPINNVRYEKLTFKNPNEEFRQKLLKAGGQPMGNPALMETAGTPSSSSSKSDSGKKLPKTSTSTTSSKDGSSSNSKDKTPKHKSSLISSSSSKPSTPQSIPVASKEIKSVTHTTTISVSKDHKSRGKEAQKRPSTSSPPDGEMSGKKIKRSSSISSDLGKEKHSHKSDKDKKKSSKDSSKSKSKHSSKSDKHEKKKDKHKHSSSNSDKKTKNTSSSETKTSSNSQSSKKSSDSIPFPSDIPMKTALLSPLKDSSDDDEDDKTVKKDSDSVSSLSSDLSSSSSSISLSPLPEAERKKSNSKYDALMAELGDSDSSDDDFNVKIPVIPPSPPPSLPPPLLPKSTPETKPVAVIESKQTKKSKSSSSQSKKSSSKSEKSKSKESKKKDSSKSSKESKTSNSKESPEVIQNGVAKEDNKSEVVAENGETLASLWELHDRIMASRDSDMLEEVVGLIQETGLFKVTDTSFDFDLCSIDKETVQKIFKCVSSVS